MAFSFTIDGDHGVVRFTGEDVFSSRDLMESIKQVTAHPDFQPDYDHLVDLRDVTSFEPDSGDIRKRSQQDRENIRLDTSRIAIVATSNVVFGMSRMYETFMEGADVTVRTFRDMAEAEAWLDLEAAATTGSKD
jgi:hypothetical protein